MFCQIYISSASWGFLFLHNFKRDSKKTCITLKALLYLRKMHFSCLKCSQSIFVNETPVSYKILPKVHLSVEILQNIFILNFNFNDINNVFIINTIKCSIKNISYIELFKHFIFNSTYIVSFFHRSWGQQLRASFCTTNTPTGMSL